MPSKEWLEKEITISREEMADIVSRQIARASTLALLTGSIKFADEIQELLMQYSARVCAEMFGDDEELEVGE